MEKTFQYQTQKISYNLYGNGKAIVLLHGFGEDSRIFNSQVEIFKNEFTVVVPDLPGSGKSDLLNGNEINLEDYADCIYQLLQHQKITSCILLGHSMGGYITLAFAEKYPDVLSGFGLIHSSAAADNDEKKNSRKQGIKMISEYGAFAFLKNTIPNLFADDFKKANSHVPGELLEQNKNLSTESLIQYYTAMMNRINRQHVLEKATVPVLFVIGKEDVAAPLDVVINQVHLPATSHINILDNVGHMSMLEAPSKLNDCLSGFVNLVYK